MTGPDKLILTLDDDELLRRLRKVASIDRQPIYRSIAGGLQTLIDLTFKRGVDPWGNAWRPLKQRNGQPLRDTGRLMASVTPRVSDQGVTIGTNLKYAAVHQFGATIRPKHKKLLRWVVDGMTFFAKKVVIPRRAYLPLDQQAKLDLPSTWEKVILGRTRSAIEAALNE